MCQTTRRSSNSLGDKEKVFNSQHLTTRLATEWCDWASETGEWEKCLVKVKSIVVCAANDIGAASEWNSAEIQCSRARSTFGEGESQARSGCVCNEAIFGHNSSDRHLGIYFLSSSMLSLLSYAVCTERSARCGRSIMETFPEPLKRADLMVQQTFHRIVLALFPSFLLLMHLIMQKLKSVFRFFDFNCFAIDQAARAIRSSDFETERNFARPLTGEVMKALKLLLFIDRCDDFFECSRNMRKKNPSNRCEWTSCVVSGGNQRKSSVHIEKQLITSNLFLHVKSLNSFVWLVYLCCCWFVYARWDRDHSNPSCCCSFNGQSNITMLWKYPNIELFLLEAHVSGSFAYIAYLELDSRAAQTGSPSLHLLFPLSHSYG